MMPYLNVHSTTLHRPTRVLIAALTIVAATIMGSRAMSEASTQEPAAHMRQATPPATDRPTEAFRAHHVEILEHLGHIDAMAERLQKESPEQQRRTMEFVATFLKEHIATHAADEERVLYPAVARHAGKDNRLTEVPIYEHTIVGRWIGELEAEAAKSEPDATFFARRALHLVGLLRGHFDIEEQVLLPVLDKAMTREQFQREVADLMPH